MTIFISPFSKELRNGNNNPKNYPYWSELINRLKLNGHEIVQVGISSEPKLVEEIIFDKKISDLSWEVKTRMDTFIAVDNFFQHFAHYYGYHGIVLWCPSDPKLFGYKENKNLYKTSSYFRKNQFETWEQIEFNSINFVEPAEVIKALES